MPRGAKTTADLERAIRTLQRRARDHEARLRAIEEQQRDPLRHSATRLHEAARNLKTGDNIDLVAGMMHFGIIDPPLSPARTNSTPVLPTGGSDLAGPGLRRRARAFLRSLFTRIRTP